jgi:hypothetical protein
MGGLSDGEMAAATQHRSNTAFSQKHSQESGKPQSQNQANQMHAKPNPDTVPQVTNGRINGRFAPGYSGNPGGSPEATRRAFNKRFLLDLAEDWQQHGREVFKRVRRESPASYLKVCAMLVPREHKVEHSNVIKSLSDQELEAMIEYLKTSLEAQAGGSIRVIEGTIEPAAATAHAPKLKNRLMLEADTAVGPRERIPRKMRPPAGE